MLRSGVALLLAVAFSGCASTWSQSDKNKLSTVAIHQPTAAKDAYQKPDATVSPGMANSIPTYTGGGLIPSLIGSAIDAAVTAKQQKKFESTNARYFDALHQTLANPPVAELEGGLHKTLAEDNFFGPRLADKSGNQLFTEIVHYGLQISPMSKDPNVLLRMRVIAKITLKLPNDEVLFTRDYVGVGSTAKSAAEIIADPSFLKASTEEAVRDLVDQLKRNLDAKLVSKR